ncbi:hypothetical protein ACP275_14G133000 [Erythranthe tilingii]
MGNSHWHYAIIDEAHRLKNPSSVIVVSGKFPDHVLNVTTNYNVVVNVKNKLDENLLMTW